MFTSMYPNFDQEMRAKRYTVATLCQDAGLKYMTIYNKVKNGKNISIEEGLILKETLGTKLTLEKLFERADVDGKAFLEKRQAG